MDKGSEMFGYRI